LSQHNHPEDRVIDDRSFLPGFVYVVSFQFRGDANDSPGIDHVIRGIENVSLCQIIPMAIFCQLIVGRARDNLAAEPGNRIIVENGAQGAGGKDVTLYLIDFINVDKRKAQFDRNSGGSTEVKLRGDELGTFL
jgi:hypothetical protein